MHGGSPATYLEAPPTLGVVQKPALNNTHPNVCRGERFFSTRSKEQRPRHPGRPAGSGSSGFATNSVHFDFPPEDCVTVGHIEILVIRTRERATGQRLRFIGFRKHSAVTSRGIKNLDAKR